MGSGLITINLTPLLGTILKAMPLPADRARILGAVADAAYSHWRNLAKERLRSTSQDYVEGLQQHITDDRAEISLEGMLPNMVEQGWTGGDMRAWLLKSGKAKMGKKGPYLNVPFAHGTPGTSGRHVGTPMPKDIHKAARKLTATLSRPGKIEAGGGGKPTVVYGQRLSPMSKNVNENALRLLTTKKQPWHSESIYTGMVRKAKVHESGKQETTGYMTWRTISMSTNAEGKHWYHPGIKARHIARDVTAYVRTVAAELVMTTLKGH